MRFQFLRLNKVLLKRGPLNLLGFGDGEKRMSVLKYVYTDIKNVISLIFEKY